MDANLLVSFDPSHEGSAKEKIDGILKEVDKKAKVMKIEEGLAYASVPDPKKAIEGLMEIAKKDKGKFDHTFNWWPVDKWCKAEVADMQKAITEIQKEIGESERWKMDLSKRHAKKEYPKDLIIKLTDVVDKKKVDLDNPEKIIRVEIVGDKAAISLFDVSGYINVVGL